MATAKCLAIIAAVMAFAAVANACDGNIVVQGGSIFDGEYVKQDTKYQEYPVWIADLSAIGLGNKAIFRSSHPAGLWAVQDSTAADPTLAFYSYAVSAAASPDEATGWNSYLEGMKIECMANPGPAPSVTPKPTEPDTPKPTADQCPDNTDLAASCGQSCTTGVDLFTVLSSEVNAGCHSYCGCSDGVCNYCCRAAGGSCYRGKELPVSLQRFDDTLDINAFPLQIRGFTRACDTSLCTADMKDNGKCDGGCNNPDCGFDQTSDGKSECCPSTYGGSYSEGATNPLACFDPHNEDNADNDDNTYLFVYKFPSCRKHVRNQGTCGSCYAFATSTAINYQMCMANDPLHYKQLSPQYIDSCYTAEEGGSGDGTTCSGGIIEYNAKEIVASEFAKGIPFEECYPYVMRDTDASSPITCSNAGPKSGCDHKFVKTHGGSSAYTGPKNFWSLPFIPENIDMIKAILRNIGPIPFRFDITEDFIHLYSAAKQFEPVDGKYNGIYSAMTDSAPAFSGGHAMVCTGYAKVKDATGADRDVFVFENSWGYPTNHDLGSIYWDMSDAQAHSVMKANFVVPGSPRTAEWLKANEWCTADGTCQTGARRKLAEAKPDGIFGGLFSKRSFRRATRRLLVDGINEINADGQVTKLKGSGEIEETDCQRPSAADGIQKSIDSITDVLSQAAGIDISVDMNEMKSCLAQASAAENFFFDFTIKIDTLLRKDVQINITKYPPGPCTRALPDNPDVCADEIGDTGMRLSQFKVAGVLLSDDGTEEFKFGNGLGPDGPTQVYEYHNYTTINYHQPGGTDIDFWQVVAAVVVGGVLVVVFVAFVRVVMRKFSRSDDYADQAMYQPNPIAVPNK